MNVRALAGLIMLLVAAGLLTVFFLTYDRNADLIPAAEPAGPVGDLPADPGTAAAAPWLQADVDSFLAGYNAAYADLWTAAHRAGFAALVAADTPEAVDAARQAARARTAWQEFTGDGAVIARLRDLRTRRDLTGLQMDQIQAAWRIAALDPATRPVTAASPQALAAAAAESLAAFHYRPDGAARPPIGLAELDARYRRSRDPRERRALWEVRLEPGARLRPDLVELRDLRNAAARAMGYSSFFDLQAADLGLTSAQLLEMVDQAVQAVMPVYKELHSWARTTLAARYGASAPPLIPADWLGPGTGQGWPDLAATAGGAGLGAATGAAGDPRAAASAAEAFFASLGFGPLPADCWRESRFGLPATPGLPRTAAWHIDRALDVRLAQTGPLDTPGLRGLAGQVGRCYTFLFCGRPEVPPLLREEPSRALGEGLTGLLSLAAAASVAPASPAPREWGSVPPRLQPLLAEALTGPVTRLPHAAGTAAHWEYDFYELDLPRHLLNTRWWEYAARFQGVAPPAPRDERYCDPACEEGLLTDPGAACHAAVGAMITYQLHRYICDQVLEQDVHAADYRGSLKAGDFLKSIMARGRTRDWAQVLRESTGQDLSPAALADYFEPLRAWLAEQNRGQPAGF